MADGRHLGKIEKSLYLSPVSSDFEENLARWYISNLLTVPTVKNVKFYKSNMAWQWPRPIQGQFVICRLGLAMFNPHIKLDMSTIRLPATKKWKAMPNVKILVFSHPLGDYGVTYTVRLWLDEKRVVDFLSSTTEFTAAALLKNRRFLTGVGHFERKFLVDGDFARNPSMDR